MSEWIEREKAIMFAHNALWGHPQECEKLEEVLRMMPADDVAPVVHAHYNNGACSNCGMPIATDCWGGGMGKNNYCYYCGAKMDGEE